MDEHESFADPSADKFFWGVLILAALCIVFGTACVVMVWQGYTLGAAVLGFLSGALVLPLAVLIGEFVMVGLDDDGEDY